MSKQLHEASKLEMRAVISFCVGGGCNCCEIYGQLHKIYGEIAMSCQAIMKWGNIFENRYEQILTMLITREDYQLSQIFKLLLMWMNACLLTNLSLCDFHLFGPIKEELSKWQYNLDNEVKAAAQEWLVGIGWDFFA